MLWFLKQELILDPLRVFAMQQITQATIYGIVRFFNRMGEINAPQFDQ